VLAEHRDGHVDVGERRHGLAVVAHVDPVVVARAGKQQRRDELRGRGGVHDDPPAPDAPRATHGERQRAATGVVDRHAEAAQGPEHLADRARAHVRVAVEADRPGREPRDRRDEPHHGAREPAVDRHVGGEGAGGDQPVLTRGVDR
jgi:hypothetical protein